MKTKILYHKDSLLIHLEGCDVLSLDFLQTESFKAIYNIKAKRIFINLPAVQENIFGKLSETLLDLYKESSKKIIPIINDYGMLVFCQKYKIPFMIGRILGTQHMQSSGSNSILRNLEEPGLLGFVFDSFFFLFTLKDIRFQQEVIKKYITIYLNFDNFLSASHECKFTTQTPCNFECRGSKDTISLLMTRGNMFGKNLYLESSTNKAPPSVDYTYIFSENIG